MYVVFEKGGIKAEWNMMDIISEPYCPYTSQFARIHGRLMGSKTILKIVRSGRGLSITTRAGDGMYGL